MSLLTAFTEELLILWCDLNQHLPTDQLLNLIDLKYRKVVLPNVLIWCISYNISMKYPIYERDIIFKCNLNAKF